MIRAFYTAKSGLINYQEQMNIVANNIANVNTTGYKAIGTSFTDLMYQNLNREAAASPAQVGHGVKIGKTDLNMNPGSLSPTDLPLDFAIIDESGFFAIQDGQGDISYSRAGNFIMSNDGGTFYLAAANGDRVLDADGGEIELTFDEKGGMSLDPKAIGIYSFSNKYGLTALGNNRYAQSEISGEATAIESPTIKQGFLEASGVDIANESVKMIESSKAFSFNSRMIQVADEVEQTINSLR